MDFIAYGTRMKHGKGEFCARVCHPWYFFSLFRTDYQIEIDSRLVSGRAGDIVIFEPNSVIYHGPVENSEMGFENDWIYVGGDEIKILLEKYPLPIGTPFSVGADFHLEHAIEKITAELIYMKVGAKEKCNMIMTQAIIDIYRAYTRDSGGTHKVKIENAREQMLSNYDRQWTLKEVARLAGYSQSRFCALYKEIYSASPIDDLINCRIEQAKLLIMYGGLNASEIADAVGFSSIYYFSKHFKKRVGLSPSQYARERGGTKK